MKEYMLLIRNQNDRQSEWTGERLQEFLTACKNYIEELTREGKLRSAQPFVRQGIMVSRSKRGWKEGPFNEHKEVIVGYYHVFAENMEEAIAITRRNPEFTFTSTARVEVRPIKIKEETTEFAYPDFTEKIL